jgi:AAHS family 4-hydroxybenzoate transporter-like MFS transporter
MVNSRAVDVAALLDKQRVSRVQYIVVGLCVLVAMFDGFDNQAIAYTAPAIAKEFALKAAALAPIFSAGLFGIMIGTVILGELGDILGRKKMLVASALIFGALTLATPLAHSAQELLWFRFVAGMGIGGVVPNVAALTAEYSPRKLREQLVTWVFMGISGGGFIGGFLSAYLIPAYGWHSVYYAGGALTLVLALVVIGLLPESIRFLVARGAQPAVVRRSLQRITTEVTESDRYYLPEEKKAGGLQVKQLFIHGRAATTVLFWIAEVVSLMIMYFLINWLPTLLHQIGLSLQSAILATALLNLGGITGSLVVGLAHRKFGAYPTVAATFVLTAVAVAALALSHGIVPIIMISSFFAGLGNIGGQSGLAALVVGAYPTVIRTTAMGWASTIGRIGSIVSPMIVGGLLAAGWQPREIYLVPVLPSLIGGACVVGVSYLILAKSRRGSEPVSAADEALIAGSAG